MGLKKASSEGLKVSGTRYDEMKGTFDVFAGDVLKEGAISLKVKRLIALSIAVVKACELCIRHNVQGALDAGATEEEIMEACYVAIMMDGGPSLNHVRMAIDALEECK